MADTAHELAERGKQLPPTSVSDWLTKLLASLE